MEWWPLVVSVLSALATVTTLVAFIRKTSKENEDDIRKKVAAENAVTQLTQRFDSFEKKSDANSEALQYSINEVSTSLQKHNRLLDQLVFEHVHNHESKINAGG